MKDFWAISDLSGAFSYRKKSNSVWMLITNGTRFSLFWSPSFDSQTFSLIVCFLWRCNNKNTRNRVKPHLKKGRKGQKRGVLGKSQFCREKKNRKIKEEKKKQKKSATHEIWLSCAWCVSNIGLNFQKTFIKKTNVLSFSSRTEESCWIIKMCLTTSRQSLLKLQSPIT